MQMNAKMRKQTQATFMAAVTVAGFVDLTRAADLTFSWIGAATAGGSTNWTVATNWAGGVSPTTFNPALTDNQYLVFGGSYNGGTTTMNAFGGTQNGAPGDYPVYKLTFNDFTNTAGTSTTGSLLITTTGSNSRILYLGAGGIFMNTSAASTAGGSVSIQNVSSATDNRIILTADQTWTVNNPTANLTVKRPIEGDFTIIKDGVGSLQLSTPAIDNIIVEGTPTAINGNARFNGTLDLRQGGVRLDTTTLQFASSGAHLVVDTNFDTSLSATNTGLDQTINGAVFLGGTGSFSFSGSSSLTLNGQVTLRSDKIVSQGGGRAVIFNGAIVGTGGITKVGAGSFIFNGTNSYSGNTSISNGFISVNDFTQLGTATSPITMGGGTSTGALVVRAADQSTNRGLTINPGGASLDYAGGLTINGPITASVPASGSLFKVGSGVLTTGSIRIGGTLDVPSSAVVIKPDGSDAASNRVGVLALAGSTGSWGSKLDLNNNKLVIDYTGASPLAQIADQIKSGYANGAWNGNGITSTSAATNNAGANPKVGIGFAEAGALGISTFAGQDVDADSIVIRYTLLGDANVDGTVNALDFNALASGYGSGTFWPSGDFDYDGAVTSADFSALSQNFNRALPGAALGTLVPEPSTICAAALLGLSAVSRRRRK
jgi:autotransporter-associated beta strand protein